MNQNILNQIDCPSPLKAFYLQRDIQLPLVIQPNQDQSKHISLDDFLGWLSENQDWLENQLLKDGGILFRGFPIVSAENFEMVIKSLNLNMVTYTQGQSPRSRVHNLSILLVNILLIKQLNFITNFLIPIIPPRKYFFSVKYLQIKMVKRQLLIVVKYLKS